MTKKTTQRTLTTYLTATHNQPRPMTNKVQAIMSAIVGMLTGMLAFVANTPPSQQSEMLGQLVAAVPVSWRPNVSLAAKFISVVATYYAIHKASSSGPATPVTAMKTPLLSFALCAVLVLGTTTGLTGCISTQDPTTGKITKKPNWTLIEQTGETVVLDSLGTLAESYVQNRNIGTAAAMSIGLNSIVDIVRASTSNQQAANLIASTANQFNTDPAFKNVGQDLAKAYLAVAPQTASDRAQTVVALATGVGNVSGLAGS